MQLDDRSIHKFFASKTLRHTNTFSIKTTTFYIMKTSHNLNNDMHSHDCLFIHCEAYPSFHSYEVYPPFHSYVHVLCFTIQTLYSYSLQIMLSSNTINQSTCRVSAQISCTISSVHFSEFFVNYLSIFYLPKANVCPVIFLSSFARYISIEMPIYKSY